MSKEVTSDVEIRREDGGKTVDGSLELRLEVLVLTSITESGQGGVEVCERLGLVESSFPSWWYDGGLLALLIP